MDPGGIVQSLQSVVRFGMVIYSGGGQGDQCVQLVTEQPALDNYAVLDAAYPQDPIGMGTPTDQALDHVVTNLPVLNVEMLDSVADPIYVVLATDGQPNDLCAAGGVLGGGGFAGGADVEQRVIDVVTRGVQGGMRMFVISLAGGDAQLQAHLEQVAQAGNTGQPPFVPATQGELVSTFQSIVGGATCQITLDGMVADGEQCRGEVVLNGQSLACESDDGWRLTDPRTVQLTGSACDSFVSTQSMVRASFPCGIFSPD
jgi:hypothetical protein